MRRYQYSDSAQAGWKSYPIRLAIDRISTCHQEPLVLVQSMRGGYVTANCVECGEKTQLGFNEFNGLAVHVSCPECRKSMLACYVPDNSKNYGYLCEPCSVYIWLADLLPFWKDAT